MKKYVQQVHERIKKLEIIQKEEEIIAKTGDLTDRIDSEGQENTDEDKSEDEREKNSPPRKSQKSNNLDNNEVVPGGYLEVDKLEEDMLTDDLEERIENLLKVKPSTEPSLAGCLAVIDNLQEENDQLLVKCEMFEELVDNQNSEIQTKNAKLVQVSEEKQFMKEQMLKLEKHLEDMFVQCETHKSSVVNKLQQQQPNAEIQRETPPIIPPKILTQPIWRPPGHPPVQVDECVENVGCEGNCEHVICHRSDTQKERETTVTCNDCNKKFRSKVEMMDHKRDSDHPSKKKCNKFPNCERGERCWYMHNTQVHSQITHVRSQVVTQLACNLCEQVFTKRNELMFHKKRVHPSNIVCSNFLGGYCRRGVSGEFCWYRHDQLPVSATNVRRPQISLPPPGSTSWDTDFPAIPTMAQSPVVGLQQQIMNVIQQQKQQQQHQQKLNMMMSQLMNLNM